MRGAANAIIQLTKEEKARGVVTHSSGNFAQALSLAAKILGVKAYIVMPKTTSEVKKNAVREYNGNIIECEPTLLARENSVKKIQEKEGATFIHPSNDLNVVLGHGAWNAKVDGKGLFELTFDFLVERQSLIVE